MTYRLRITRIEENPNFAEELKSYEQGRRYQNYDLGSGPVREHEIATLDAVISEDEWVTIKRALVATWQAAPPTVARAELSAGSQGDAQGASGPVGEP